MKKKTKIIFGYLIFAMVAITAMAFTLNDPKPIKLSSYEIDKVKALVNDFYDCSNEISDNLSGSGECRIRLTDNYFGELGSCPIYNDFSIGNTEFPTYFPRIDNYIMTLQRTHIRMTVESLKPSRGEWTKVLKAKMDSSDPDSYNVAVCVKKRVKQNDSDQGVVVNQSINVSLPGYTITGIHPDTPVMPSSSSNSGGNATTNQSQSGVEPGNYIALAFEYYAAKDYAKALELFEKQIALCGDPEAYYYAAIMYYKKQGCKGMGYSKRYEKFVEGMRVAAKAGNRRAKYTLVREGVE